MTPPTHTAFLDAATQILGSSNVDRPAIANNRYGANTIGAVRFIEGAVRPANRDEVMALVQLANTHNTPLYSFSRGKNWGYGSALPVASGCIVVDLSRLDRVREVNKRLGYVVVEPGVSQQSLYNHLIKEQGTEFMVPTSGAGPQASILGNALERGYGITPHEDHFGAVLGLEAVLADGSLYTSTLRALGGTQVDPVFKWKIGPYVEGLFTQGNVGIVTAGTIALARKPETVSQFIIFVREEEFESAVEAIREIKSQLGSLLGGVNLMNRRRILAMTTPSDHWAGPVALGEMRVRALARKTRLNDWTIVGGLFGPNELTEGAFRHIRRIFGKFSERVIFVNRRRLRVANALLRLIPLPSYTRMVESASKALDILEGTPSNVALPAAYLKIPEGPPNPARLDPDQDNCGLLWFAPLVPLDPVIARDFSQEVTRLALAYDIDPLVTFTTISDRVFDCTVPILFRKTAEDIANARDCYDTLLRMAQDFGLFPYRLDIDHMPLIQHLNTPSTRIISLIKKALDPHAIFSPGRYTQ